MQVFFNKNKLIGQKIRENAGFVVSELVVGSVEQDRTLEINDPNIDMDVLFSKRKMCAKA